MEALIEKDGYINYLIETDKDKEYNLSFKIYQVISWTGEKNNDPGDIELFISGFIKWDGCSHLYFGDGDGYLHLCGKAYFKELKEVLDAVWEKAEKEIINFDGD